MQKILITFMSAVLLSSVSPANILCKSHPSLPYVVKLEINETYKSYTISVVGFRNEYVAEYAYAKTVTEVTTNPFKIIDYHVLTKTIDHSTWKDMPNELTYQSRLSIRSQNSYQVGGLNSILGNNGTVFFHPDNCLD